MLNFLNFIRTDELDMLSVTLRLLCAMICGGFIGLERERKRRPAGFRTHILICLGAAMTTLTSQFLVLELHLFTDMARLGAQVIAGIGFIGAGTIIITQRRQVKGLTTAAGLWAAAIVGLCCGAGFLEGALLSTAIILIAELVFSKLEYMIVSNTRIINLYVEYSNHSQLGLIVDTIKQQGAYISDMEISKSTDGSRNPSVVFAIHKPRRLSHQALMSLVTRLEGVVSVEEL